MRTRRGRIRTRRVPAEACSCCAPIWFRSRCEAFSRPWRERCCSAGAGRLAQQVKRLDAIEPAAAPPPRRSPAIRQPEAASARPALEFFNGLGGFAADGREYVTILGEGQWTPAPWINVIANPSFGFQVSAEGAGYTWSINSRENQITPWSNDPVSDRPGEVIYVRDEDTNELWGPTALPIREDAAPYSVRHGQGYSVFEHTAHGISLELEQFVPLEDSIKISRLKIRNLSARSRRLSVTAYVEWVLGTSRGASAPFIVTEVDPDTRAMLARNSFSTDYRQPRGIRGLGRPATLMDGRPHRVSRPQRESRQSGRARRCRAALQSSRRRARSLRRPADPCRAQAERRDRNRFLSRRGGDQGGSAFTGRKIPNRRPRRGPRRDRRVYGTTSSARFR